MLEGRNWKHLDSRQGPELGCMRETVPSWFMMNLITGYAGAIEQEVNYRRNVWEFDINFCYCNRYVNQPVHNVLGCHHHLHRAHPSEVVSQLRGHAGVEGSARSRRRSSLELGIWGHDGVKRRL